MFHLLFYTQSHSGSQIFNSAPSRTGAPLSAILYKHIKLRTKPLDTAMLFRDASFSCVFLGCVNALSQVYLLY